MVGFGAWLDAYQGRLLNPSEGWFWSVLFIAGNHFCLLKCQRRFCSQWRLPRVKPREWTVSRIILLSVFRICWIQIASISGHHFQIEILRFGEREIRDFVFARNPPLQVHWKDEVKTYYRSRPRIVVRLGLIRWWYGIYTTRFSLFWDSLVVEEWKEYPHFNILQ